MDSIYLILAVLATDKCDAVLMRCWWDAYLKSVALLRNIHT